MAGADVVVSSLNELSAAGAGFVAGRSAGLFDHNVIYEKVERRAFKPAMDADAVASKRAGWHLALKQATTH